MLSITHPRSPFSPLDESAEGIMPPRAERWPTCPVPNHKDCTADYNFFLLLMLSGSVCT